MEYVLPYAKWAQLRYKAAKERTGRFGWSRNQKIHRRLLGVLGSEKRVPPPFIGPKYMTNNNWKQMSMWNKTQFTFESASQKAKFISYFFSELKRTNWDPKKVTWLIANTIPILDNEIKGLYRVLNFLRIGGQAPTLFETLFFISTGLVTISHTYTFGISTRILTSLAQQVGYLLITKGASMTWYTFKQLLRLITKLCYYLSQSPALLRRVIQAAKKIRKIEPSPKKAFSIAYSASPVSSVKQNKIIQAVTTVAKSSPKFKLKSPTPKFYSARSRTI